MGDNRHHHHHHHHNIKYYHHQQRTTFLPMLCSRPSLKDVSLPRWRNRTASFSKDPSSPKIGCMGQVKRNNRIVATSESHNAATTSSSVLVKYSKLRKIFSVKSISTTSTPDSAHTVSRNNGNDHRTNKCVGLSIDEMDPPLPVKKKVQKSEQEREAESLWKRRSGGVALKSLQLQQIQHPSTHRLFQTSV